MRSQRMNLYDEFEWRGMLYEATPELREVLGKEKLTAYIGFDPSAAYVRRFAQQAPLSQASDLARRPRRDLRHA